MATDRIFRTVKKKFLTNDANEFGTLCYEVEACRHADDVPYKMSASLRLQDCHETIFLDFYVGSKSGRFQNRIQKIQSMIDSLEEMKSVMESGFEMLETRNSILVPSVESKTKSPSTPITINELNINNDDDCY